MNNARGVSLTDGQLLAKNSLWNLIGCCLPILAAVLAIPLLMKGLGTERFGLLMLIWMGIGYFGLLDVGLGQALTKLIAERLGVGAAQVIPGLVWTAIVLMAAFSIVGAISFAFCSSMLIERVLQIPAQFKEETLSSFYLLAASLPVVICAGGFCGVLEAHQRFDLVNAVRIIAGLLSFLLPLPILLISHNLIWIVAALFAIRLGVCLAYAVLCLQAVPSLRRVIWSSEMVRPLLSFGGWMSVSNVIGPLMVYMDRFFIGAIISMSAVAYYTTPYEVVSRLTVVPVAIMGVLFPAFSTILVQQRGSALRLFERGLSYILLVLFPLTLLFVTFAAEGLEIWLGPDFATNSSPVLRWLAVGVFINSLARMPFAVIQAQGRPDITAKLHLIELPIYVGLLWWLVHQYGFLGAAVTWVVRIAVDTISLFVIAARLLPDMQPVVITLSKRATIALLALGLAAVTADLYVRVLLFALALLIFLPFAWFGLLGSHERQLVRDKLRAVGFAAAGE